MGLVYFSFHNTGYRAVLSVEEQGIAIKPGKLYLQLNVQYTIFFYSSLEYIEHSYQLAFFFIDFVLSILI